MQRVIEFEPYIELMTILEEQFNGFKGINEHKLFSGTVKRTQLQKRKYHLLFLKNETTGSFIHR